MTLCRYIWSWSDPHLHHHHHHHHHHHDHHHHLLLHCSSFECPASNNTPCLLTIAANWARSAPDRWRKLASQASSFPLSFAYKSTTKMWLGPNKGNGPQPFPLLLKDCTAWLLDVTWFLRLSRLDDFFVFCNSGIEFHHGFNAAALGFTAESSCQKLQGFGPSDPLGYPTSSKQLSIAVMHPSSHSNTSLYTSSLYILYMIYVRKQCIAM